MTSLNLLGLFLGIDPLGFFSLGLEPVADGPQCADGKSAQLGQPQITRQVDVFCRVRVDVDEMGAVGSGAFDELGSGWDERMNRRSQDSVAFDKLNNG